jgi:hypothetical protein
MRGHETPENHPLTIPKVFSTVSEELNTAPDHSLRLSRILLTSRFSAYKGYIRLKKAMDGRVYEEEGEDAE